MSFRPAAFTVLALALLIGIAACARTRVVTKPAPRRPSLGALLPAPYGADDLLPMTEDPVKWERAEDLAYEQARKIALSVDIDGPSDCDIAISRTGVIALSELDHSKSVSFYSSEGSFLSLKKVPKDPTGVAFDPAGGLLVSSNFGPLVRIAQDGSIEPWANLSATDDITTGQDGVVFAIDSSRNSIVRVQYGILGRRIPIDDYRSGMKKIFVASRGLVTLADWSRQVVEVYDRDGTMVRRIATKERPWGVVSSGSILCYSTSRGLVFHDFVRNEPVAEIETVHHCAALALGPRGELLIADEDGDALYVYERRASGSDG